MGDPRLHSNMAGVMNFRGSGPSKLERENANGGGCAAQPGPRPFLARNPRRGHRDVGVRTLRAIPTSGPACSSRSRYGEVRGSWLVFGPRNRLSARSPDRVASLNPGEHRPAKKPVIPKLE